MAHYIFGFTEERTPIDFNLCMANRHGLIAGATGTGKTVSMQSLIEYLVSAGVNVFSADVKGDLSGLAFPGGDNKKVNQRLQEFDIKPNFQGVTVELWDIYGEEGHPLRASISKMGPLLFSRILGVNEIQQDVLNTAFKYADDHGLLLIDLKDISSLLDWIADHAAELQRSYGNFSASSIGAIKRRLLVLQESGGDVFFAEPAFDVKELLKTSSKDAGVVHILAADRLIQNGLLYSTFLLWLLSELFETLPEVGDLPQPKLVFFFDEAHLLFDTASKLLLTKIIQMVRLIRSKGVGVYFVTQSPTDIPEEVLGQLGNRVQHALRAYTPKDQKVVKSAAQTFRQNPAINAEKIITELAVGEALTSFLDESGVPALVEKTKVVPPMSRIGSITDKERDQLIHQSPLYGVYEKRIDAESAYETLSRRQNERISREKQEGKTTSKRSSGRPRQSATESLIKSTARSMGTQIGRQIVRGLLGSIFGKK